MLIAHRQAGRGKILISRGAATQGGARRHLQVGRIKCKSS